MSTGAWWAVAVAVAAAGLGLGTHLTLPMWRTRGDAPRFAPALLTAQAGGVLALGVVALTAAARSWLLVDRPVDQPVARTLLSVSRIDGDGSMFALVVLGLVTAVVLVGALLLTAARLARGAHPGDRAVACVVLAVEVALSAYGLADVVGGSRSAPALLALVHLPVAMAALVACWPVAQDDLEAVAPR